MNYLDFITATLVADILAGKNPDLPTELTIAPRSDAELTTEVFSVFNPTDHWVNNVVPYIDAPTTPMLAQLKLAKELSAALDDAIMAVIPSQPEVSQLKRNSLLQSDPTAYDQWLESADHVVNWMTDHLDPVASIAGNKQMIGVRKLPFNTMKMPSFDRFAAKFKNIIMAQSTTPGMTL